MHHSRVELAALVAPVVALALGLCTSCHQPGSTLCQYGWICPFDTLCIDIGEQSTCVPLSCGDGFIQPGTGSRTRTRNRKPDPEPEPEPGVFSRATARATKAVFVVHEGFAHETRRPRIPRLTERLPRRRRVVTPPALLVFMNHENSLLRFDAFTVSLEMVRGVRSLLPGIRKHSASLARQLCDAACSVPLNVAEGRRRVGRDRLHLWRVAAGSAEECRAILYTAEAIGYLDTSACRSTLESIDRVLAMLWRMTRS